MGLGLRDIADVEYDARADGAEVPNWLVLIPDLPCHVIDLGGDETYRGRQLEGHISHVVRSSFNPEFGRIRSTMRLVVKESSYAAPDGTVLNVEHTRQLRVPGRDDAFEFYCRRVA